MNHVLFCFTDFDLNCSIQSILHTHWLCICRFNQVQIEIFEKNNSRKFQKAKLDYAVHQQLFTLHLHCVRCYK